MKKSNESGRSMVEMIGVLAIIGVLSIMGIAGYTTAIKKHKANTLMQGVMRHAVVVAGKLSLGTDIAAVDGFEETTDYGNFLFTPPAADATQFKIEVTDVNEEVCTQLRAMGEKSDAVDFVEAACTSNSIGFVFNKDLGNGEASSGGLACNDDQEAVDGTCMARCPEGVTRGRDKSCSVCANGNVYLSYESEPCQRSVSGCKSNDDCNEGQYCNLTGSGCYYPTTGTCANIGTPRTAHIDGLGDTILSTSSMSWWAGMNWCAAQGMRLMNIEEFQCYQSGTTNLVTADSYYDGGCCAKGKSCGWDYNWFTDDNKERFSIVLYNIKQAYGLRDWLNTASPNPNESSCYFTVPSTDVGYALARGHRHDRTYVLCVK